VKVLRHYYSINSFRNREGVSRKDFLSSSSFHLHYTPIIRFCQERRGNFILNSDYKNNEKNFFYSFQNMVRADIFPRSLAVWKDCGEAASPIFLSERRRSQGLDKNKFELYSIYTASQDFSSVLTPRASLTLGARLLIYIHFWAKIGKIYQLRTKENFFIIKPSQKL